MCILTSFIKNVFNITHDNNHHDFERIYKKMFFHDTLKVLQNILNHILNIIRNAKFIKRDDRSRKVFNLFCRHLFIFTFLS